MWARKPRKMTNKGLTCKFPGCKFHAVAKGYCVNHYSYMRKKNDRDDI